MTFLFDAMAFNTDYECASKIIDIIEKHGEAVFLYNDSQIKDYPIEWTKYTQLNENNCLKNVDVYVSLSREIPKCVQSNTHIISVTILIDIISWLYGKCSPEHCYYSDRNWNKYDVIFSVVDFGRDVFF